MKEIYKLSANLKITLLLVLLSVGLFSSTINAKIPLYLDSGVYVNSINPYSPNDDNMKFTDSNDSQYEGFDRVQTMLDNNLLSKNNVLRSASVNIAGPQIVCAGEDARFVITKTGDWSTATDQAVNVTATGDGTTGTIVNEYGSNVFAQGDSLVILVETVYNGTNTFTVNVSFNHDGNTPQSVDYDVAINTTAPVVAEGVTLPTLIEDINALASDKPEGFTETEFAAFFESCYNIQVTKSVVAGSDTGDNCLWGITYSYQVIDEFGNVSNGSPFEVQYTGGDMTAPVISCVGDTSFSISANNTVYVNLGVGLDATATDENNGTPTLSYNLTGATNLSGLTTLENATFAVGNTEVTAYASDDCDNIDSCKFTVLVMDSLKPYFTKSCIDIGDQTANTAQDTTIYTHSGTEWDVLADDNEGIESIVWTLTGQTTNSTGNTTLDGVEFNMGATTVTWVITDIIGLKDSCSFIVTVKDKQPPTFVVGCDAIADPVVSVDDDVLTYTNNGTDWDLQVTDNVGVESLTWAISGATVNSGNTTLDGVVFNLGVSTVEWTALDVNGNDTTCSYIVTVVDSVPPQFVVSCDDITDTLFNTDQGESFYTHSGTSLDVTATDNHGVASLSWTMSGASTGTGDNTLDGAVFNVGVTTVEWIVTDSSNNADTCTYNVTVEDNEIPVFTFDCDSIGDKTVGNTIGESFYTHSGNSWDAQAIDNVQLESNIVMLSGATVENSGTLTTLDGVNFNLGLTTVEWIATDTSGNVNNCTFNVTVNDTENPQFVINCANITNTEVNTDPLIDTYTHPDNSWDITATDNSGVVNITWTLTGVTVGSGDVTLAGQSFNIGETTVKWIISDDAGNLDSCEYIVNVIDNEPPIFIVGCDIIENQNPTIDEGVLTYTHYGDSWDVIATDNSGEPVSYYWELTGKTTNEGITTLNGVTFNLGETSVEWFVEDIYGNVDSCIFIVTVYDSTAPTFIVSCADIAAGNTTFPADMGQTYYTHSGTSLDVTAEDVSGVYPMEWTISGATMGTGTETLDGVMFNIGVTTVEWTAKDSLNNTVSCSYDITVEDKEAPVFTYSCDDIVNTEVSTNPGEDFYTHSGTAWDVIATDNTNTVLLSWELTGATTNSGVNTLDGVNFNMGITNVEWTAKDTSDNFITCTFDVEVKDTEAPVFVIDCDTIGDQLESAEPGQYFYTKDDNTWDVTATDNSGSVIITWTLSGSTTGNGSTTLQGQTFNVGTTTVEWTIKDSANNSETCTYNVVVTDDEAPTFVISCDSIDNQIAFTNPDTSIYTHNGTAWDVTATDNSGYVELSWTLSGATVNTGDTSLDGVEFNYGVTTVEWTALDSANLSVSCSYTVTVNDNQPPTFVYGCDEIGSQEVNPDPNTSTYTKNGTDWDCTASDNIGVVSVIANLTGATVASGLTSLDGVLFNMGVTTVEWIATDQSGLTQSCTFTVTVIDMEAPVFTYDCEAIGDHNVSIDMGVPTYTHLGTEWDAVATDNSGTVILTANLTGATEIEGLTTLDNVVFNYGVTTVEWTAVDPTGNDTTCSFTVTVYDDEAPTIINCSHIGDQYVFTQYDLPVYIHNGTEWDPIALDNSGVVLFTWTLTGATNGTGETTLHDIEFNLGETSVQWIASDLAGNTDTCEYVVVVADLQPPTFVISCEVIGNKVAFMDAGTTTYTHNGTDWDVTGTDNVGVVSTTWTLTGATSGTGNTTIDGVVFNFGETKVEWVIADISGNTDTCEYVVMVVDNVAPTFVVGCDEIGDQEVSINNGSGYTHTGNAWDVTAVDNTSDVTLTWALSGATVLTGATTLDGVTFNMGETTVEWTATDEYNNSVSCTYIVTVTDNDAPTFVVNCETIGDQTVEIGADASNYTHSGTAWDVTAEDNSGTVTLTWALSGATTATGANTLDDVTFNIGVTTVEWTATDAYGNVATCTYTVTVNQIIPGTWTVSCDEIGDQVVTVNNGNVYMHSGVNWDVTAHDNTGIIVVTWELTGATTGTGQITMNGVEFNIGVTTVTWTAVDAYGNVFTCSYTVTVNGEVDPLVWAVSCEDIGDQVVDANNGDTYVHSGVNWDATATSGAGTVITNWTLTGATTATGQLTLNGVTFNLGTTTVAWTATDPAGNTIECSYTVTVNEVVTPTVTWIVGCDQIGNQVVDANNGDTYLHSGNGWDATATSTAGDVTVTWTLTGATTATGATTLDGVIFNLGITTVEWTATDVAGNIITCSYTVTVNEGGTPDQYVTIVGPDHVCYGETVTLEAQVIGIDNASFLWNTGDDSNIITVIPYEDVNEYTVVVTDINGIEYQASHVVTLDETPNLYISLDELQAVCLGDSITIFSEVDNVEIASYLWSTGDTTPNIRYVPTELNSVVSLTVTSVNGCTRTEDLFVSAVDCSDVPIIVYPNPADQYIIVEAAAVKITLLDEAGNLIMIEKGNDNHITTIDVSRLPSGFYVVYIFLEDGRFDTRKIIIYHE